MTTIKEADSPGQKKLILHVEVPDVFVDDLAVYVAEAMVDGEEPTPRDYASILTSEWVRTEVGLTLVTLPGEMTGNDEFEVHASTGRIVGIEISDKAAGQ